MLRFQAAARAVQKPSSKVQPSLSQSQLLHHPRISRSFAAIQQIRHASTASSQLQPAPSPPEGNVGIGLGNDGDRLPRRARENHGSPRGKWMSPRQQQLPRQFNNNRPKNQQQQPYKHDSNKINYYKKYNNNNNNHNHDIQYVPKFDAETKREPPKIPTWWPFLVPGELPVASRSKDVQLDWAIKAIKSKSTPLSTMNLMDQVKWAERNIIPLDQSVRQNPEVHRYIQQLLSNVYIAKHQDPLDYSLPSLTQIFQLQCASNTTNDVNQLFQIAISQARWITQMIVDTAKYPPGPDSTESAIRDAIFADQDAFWKFVFTKPPLAAVPDISQFIEFPEVASTRLAILKGEGVDLKTAIEMLLPWHNPSSVPQLAAALASWYLTFSLCSSTLKPARDGFVEIRQMLDKVFSSLGVIRTDILGILSEYPQMDINLRKLYAAMSDSPKLKAATTTQALNSFHERLSEAYNSRNVVRCQQLLCEFPEACSVGKDVTPEERELQASAFNYFIFVFCALRCNTHVDMTLNAMSSKGFPVDSKTYTSMISGWRETREMHKITALWKMLIDRKTPLDDIVWSARISAYERFGWTRQAVQALFEMDAMYRATPEGHQDNFTAPPTINVVNPVLTGLFRRRDVAGVRQILSWAEQRNIELNLASYNILLEGMLKCGLNTEAPLLLDAMRDHGIDPDIATYTILLEHALTNQTSGATAGEQVAAVLDIIATFEKSDISMHSATYAKMLHIVLNSDTISINSNTAEKDAGQYAAGDAANGLSTASALVSETSSSDANASGSTAATTTSTTTTTASSHRGSSAAQVILEHMSSHNVPLTAHIYTILVEHYFARGNAAAVHALIQDWKLDESLMDPVFWEVVISGFASLRCVAMVDRYTALFRRLWPHGRMAMGAQSDLILFLLSQGREEQAAHLVAREMEHAKETHVQPDDRYWDHRFWHVAREKLGMWMG